MYMAKEPYVYGKRGLGIWQKSPMYMAKEAKEPYVYGKRGLLASPETYAQNSKEPCAYGKRGQIISIKRGLIMAKEA